MEVPRLRPKRDRRQQPRIQRPAIACTVPEDGDIVVREQHRAGTIVYLLHTAPSVSEYVLRNRGEAVAQAMASARRHYTRAWLTDEGYIFTLLEDFR
jgi:hypothetical protein